MNLSNVKVVYRLAVAFGLVLAISVIAALLSLSRLSGIQDDLKNIVRVNKFKVRLNRDMLNSVHVVPGVMYENVLLSASDRKNCT